MATSWWSGTGEGSSGGDTSLYSIQGQRYGADGSPDAEGSCRINSYTTSYQRIPAVGMDADGDFVVAWQSNGSSGGDTPSRAFRGSASRRPETALGGQFQVNTYTSNFQDSAAIALSADGDFVVVWRSWGSSGGDTSDGSIQGQRFRVTGELLGKVFFDANVERTAERRPNTGITGVHGEELYDDTLTLRRTAATDAPRRIPPSSQGRELAPALRGAAGLLHNPPPRRRRHGFDSDAAAGDRRDARPSPE